MKYYIKFLGTAGARVVVLKQLRSSAGTWLSFNETNILLDPGPGTLVKCHSSKPKLDPSKLDGIILTHRHIDHSTDINIMIEAMTSGGFKKKGALFAPNDSLNMSEVDEYPCIMKYLRKYLEKIEKLEEGKSYKINDIEFSTPLRHIHSDVETYGIKFKIKNLTISFIVDTRFFPELIDAYRSDIIILNVVRFKPHESVEIDHLCIDDAKKIIKNISPKVAVITHFGMTMISNKPWQLAEQMKNEIGIEAISANDGMTFPLDDVIKELNSISTNQEIKDSGKQLDLI